MTSQAQLIFKALRNQDTLNGKVKDANGPVGQDWTIRGWPYYRAAHTEATEALNWLNWFWWKTGSYGEPLTDEAVAGVQGELCDILHFGLSMDVIKFGRGEEALKARADAYVTAFKEADEKSRSLEVELEDFIASTILNPQTFCVYTFARACHAAKLSFPALLVRYFGKSVLNNFRWNNGYNLPKGSVGGYVKMWGGAGQPPQEDNYFLERAIRHLLEKNTDEDLLASLDDGTFEDMLYKRLVSLYPGNAK